MTHTSIYRCAMIHIYSILQSRAGSAYCTFYIRNHIPPASNTSGLQTSSEICSQELGRIHGLVNFVVHAFTVYRVRAHSHTSYFIVNSSWSCTAPLTPRAGKRQTPSQPAAPSCTHLCLHICCKCPHAPPSVRFNPLTSPYTTSAASQTSPLHAPPCIRSASPTYHNLACLTKLSQPHLPHQPIITPPASPTYHNPACLTNLS